MSNYKIKIKYNNTDIYNTSTATVGFNKKLLTANKILNSNVIIEATNSRLPIGFQECEWIQSDGNQYMDLGITETNDTAIDLHFYNVTPSRNYLYGARQSSGSMIYNGLYNNNSLEYNWLTINYTAASDIIMTQNVSGTTNTIIINGVTTTASTGTSNKENIFLFGCNNASVRKYTALRVYYFIIKQGGSKKRELIPCYSTISVTGYKGATAVSCSSGTIGLYDLIGERFYINSGSGTFTKGADVN